MGCANRPPASFPKNVSYLCLSLVPLLYLFALFPCHRMPPRPCTWPPHRNLHRPSRQDTLQLTYACCPYLCDVAAAALCVSPRRRLPPLSSLPITHQSDAAAPPPPYHTPPPHPYVALVITTRAWLLGSQRERRGARQFSGRVIACRSPAAPSPDCCYSYCWRCRSRCCCYYWCYCYCCCC